MFDEKQIKDLSAPLVKANVKKNPRGYSYVEGWKAIDEANRIFGFDGWDRELRTLKNLGEAYKSGDNWRVGYIATVRITVTAGETEVVREGTGYGSGIGKDLNDCHESAAKEAETDAMKRALMTFGNPFGLALYDKEQTNVVEAPPAEPSETLRQLRRTLAECTSSQECKAWLAKHREAAEMLDDAERATIQQEYTASKAHHDEAARLAA